MAMTVPSGSGAGNGVGGQGDQRGLASRLVLELAERLGGHEGQGGALRGQLVQPAQAAPEPLVGVIRHLVAIPAPVPELRGRGQVEQPEGERHLEGMEDDDRCGLAGKRPEQAAGLTAPEAEPERGGEAADRAVGHTRRLDGEGARRLEQVFGLVAQDEGLQRARQQEDGEGLV
jgi:hypothetical protein